MLDRARRRDHPIAPPVAVASDGTEALADRLIELAHRATVTDAELLAALALFDEQEGWRANGARSAVAWMTAELGYTRSLAYEKLAVAHKLRELPSIAGLFASGELGWSKVRALCRVATPEDERALAIAALDLDADGTQRLCDDYRFANDPTGDAERERLQHERRSLTYHRRADGSIAMHVVLPPELAADVIRCLEHREDLLYGAGASERQRAAGVHGVDADGVTLATADGALDVDGSESASTNEHEGGGDASSRARRVHTVDTGSAERPTARQRRADALVAMAHASLAGGDASDAAAGKADRYLVVAQIDAEALEAAERQIAGEPVDNEAPLPTPIRAAIGGILGGSISPAKARKLACDGSLVTVILRGGEPIAIGRRRRLHTSAQRRAILARDGCCTFPGCGATRHLDVHHVTLWSDGGETSVKHGTTLCAACHQRVHDEGWRVTRRADDLAIDRNPKADRLLDDADERTRSVTRTFDTRRARFEFERPSGGNGPGADSPARDCCAERRAIYRTRPSHRVIDSARRIGRMRPQGFASTP